jgi:gentisate 1,2-dioxygenase
MNSAVKKTAKDKNWYDELIKLRDKERKRIAKSKMLIKDKELPLELNPQGLMKWYLHPANDSTAHKLVMFSVQEIPPKSRSGKQKYQGGMVIYIIQGRGYTVIDGTKYPWKAEDLVQLPIRPDGIVFQHFNASTKETAKLICCEPNLIGAVGVDRGSGFEQLEAAPEYSKQNK